MSNQMEQFKGPNFLKELLITRESYLGFTVGFLERWT